MKRQATEKLIKWKDKTNRKPLLIQGARQVGKSWLMKEFGKVYYKKTAYISLSDNLDAHKIFEGSYDLQNMIQALSAISKVKITPNDTLIILDEIQECEKALNALKYFNENAKNYHIIAAGSLLGVAIRHQKMSFPVGQVEFLNLYPLSFIEFLEAKGEDELKNVIFAKNISLIKMLHEKYIRLLKEYFVIGGMPEAVNLYLENNDFNEVRTIQNQIIEGYKQDFAKYSSSANIPKIIATWNSIPNQLAKENSKFMFNLISKGARAREYREAIDWLNLSGLTYEINRIEKPSVPLTSYVDNLAFKFYVLDVGLLCALARLPMDTVFYDNQIFEEFKGKLTESYVLQELKLLGLEPICYYAKESKAEVDFVTQIGSDVIPIEVKAGVNLKSKSLLSYRTKFNPKKAVRTSLSNFEINSGLYNIPLYLVGNLIEYLHIEKY